MHFIDKAIRSSFHFQFSMTKGKVLKEKKTKKITAFKLTHKNKPREEPEWQISLYFAKKKNNNNKMFKFAYLYNRYTDMKQFGNV